MEDKRNYFYKYYNIKSGILTLENTIIKWSNPIEFNDPFDNQFDALLAETQEDTENSIKEYVIDCFLNDKSFNFKNLSSKHELLIQQIRNTPKEQFEKIIPLLKEDKTIYPPDLVENHHKELNEMFKDIMKSSSVFCLTEKKDNLLMWAHYADNHTGIVVKFRDVPEKDSPIKLAKKITYSHNIPKISIAKIATNGITIQELQDIYTFTKSTHWEYEKEWRIVGGLRDTSKTHEILPFAKEEVADVYLGCRINSGNKQKILEIIKTKYPWAGIYQAHKDTKEFKLVFEKIEY